MAAVRWATFLIGAETPYLVQPNPDGTCLVYVMEEIWSKAMQNNFVVRDTSGDIDPHLFWSDKFGWTDRFSATVFTASAKEVLDLPIDGEWVDACTLT